MARTLKYLATIVGSFAIAAPVFAHTGTTTEVSLMAGLSHPLTGFDHLLAMLAIGIWAAMQRGTSSLTYPVVFIIMLMTGFLLGLNGLSIPFIEAGIATSVFLLGLAIVFTTRLPSLLSLPLISTFALYHGLAHGIELGTASAVYFAAGFISSSALLHLLGASFSKASMLVLPQLNRVIGALITMAGFSFLIA